MTMTVETPTRAPVESLTPGHLPYLSTLIQAPLQPQLQDPYDLHCSSRSRHWDCSGSSQSALPTSERHSTYGARQGNTPYSFTLLNPHHSRAAPRTHAPRAAATASLRVPRPGGLRMRNLPQSLLGRWPTPRRSAPQSLSVVPVTSAAQ